MCEQFVRTHMPPEEEQLNEVLQLRSQGMTYNADRRENRPPTIDRSALVPVQHTQVTSEG